MSDRTSNRKNQEKIRKNLFGVEAVPEMRKCKSAGIQKKNWQMGQTTSDWSKTESKKIVRRSCDEEQNLQTDDLLNVQEKVSEKSDSRSSSELRRTAERDLAMSNMSSFRTFRTISP